MALHAWIEKNEGKKKKKEKNPGVWARTMIYYITKQIFCGLSSPHGGSLACGAGMSFVKVTDISSLSR